MFDLYIEMIVCFLWWIEEKMCRPIILFGNCWMETTSWIFDVLWFWFNWLHESAFSQIQFDGKYTNWIRQFAIELNTTCQKMIFFYICLPFDCFQLKMDLPVFFFASLSAKRLIFRRHIQKMRCWNQNSKKKTAMLST